MTTEKFLSAVSKVQPTSRMPVLAYFVNNAAMQTTRQAAITACLLLGGCASASQFSAMPDAANIQSVTTPYRALAQCIGESMTMTHPNQTVEIAIGSITDETVPQTALSKPLSNGAGLWVRTLATQMGKQVKVLVSKNGALLPDRGEADMLVINGAWTQNDQVTDSTAARFKFKLGGFEIGSGIDDSYTMIAGDFLWYRYGANHVQGAVSILAAVKTVSGEGDIFINSGGAGIASTVRLQSVQGVHLSQRTALEFAIAKIIADATGVNMQFCIDEPHLAPEFAKKQAATFQNMLPVRQNSAVQELLVSLGYLAEADKSLWGGWNSAARQALRKFLSDRGMPPSNEPYARHYVALQLATRQSG